MTNRGYVLALSLVVTSLCGCTSYSFNLLENGRHLYGTRTTAFLIFSITHHIACDVDDRRRLAKCWELEVADLEESPGVAAESKPRRDSQPEGRKSPDSPEGAEPPVEEPGPRSCTSASDCERGTACVNKVCR